MFLRANPYQIFQFSKTPVGLYARQKWLGQESSKSWKIDFESTVKKILADQLSDGSWSGSVLSTIRYLFDLHLTLRERTAAVNKGLEWLIDRSIENFPHKRVVPKLGIRNNSLKSLPFSKGCSGYLLYSATLFLSSVFGRDQDSRILSFYEWFDKLGIKNSGKWCGWSCGNNILRAFIVDAFLRQCLKLKSHYTTGSQIIQVNDLIFPITGQDILIKTINLLSKMLLSFKILFTMGHNALSQTIMTLLRRDIPYA